MFLLEEVYICLFFDGEYDGVVICVVLVQKGDVSVWCLVWWWCYSICSVRAVGGVVVRSLWSEHFVWKSVLFFVEKSAVCMIFRVECDVDVVGVVFSA